MILIIGLFMKIEPQYFLGSERIDYMRCTYKYSLINSNSNFKNIIVGDSKCAVGINPPILGKNWGNLAIEGSDYFEAYISLKRYLKQNKVDTILLCNDVRATFEGVYSRLDEETIPFQFNTYQELLDLEQVENKVGYMICDNYNFQNTCFGKKVVSDKDYFLYKQYLRRLRYLHSPLSYRETFIDGLFNFSLNSYSKKVDDLTIDYMKKNAGQFYIGLADRYDGANMILNLDKKFNANLVNISYLDSILTMAKKNRIFTCIILAPINQNTHEKFLHSVFKSSFDTFIDSLKLKFPSLVFLNSTLIGLPNTCFGDGGHTNVNGTVTFTNIIKSKLKELNSENKKM